MRSLGSLVSRSLIHSASLCRRRLLFSSLLPTTHARCVSTHVPSHQVDGCSSTRVSPLFTQLFTSITSPSSLSPSTRVNAQHTANNTASTAPNGVDFQSSWLPRHFLPNLTEAALYVEARQDKFLTVPPADFTNGHATSLPINASAGVARLPRLIQDAALFVTTSPLALSSPPTQTIQPSSEHYATKAAEGTASPLPGGDSGAAAAAAELAREPPFVRGLLEQALLSLYCPSVLDDLTQAHVVDGVCAEKDRERDAGNIFVYKYPYCNYPEELRNKLEACLRPVLRASAFSMYLAFESLVGSPERQRSTYTRLLALEVFALWWWCNPDLMPCDLPPSLRYVPSGGVVGEQVKARALDLMQPSQNARFTRARRQGGFLEPEAIFPPSYASALRSRLAGLQNKKYYISSALVARVVLVASSLASTDAGDLTSPTVTRSRQLVQQLVCQWIGQVFCNDATATSTSSFLNADKKEGFDIRGSERADTTSEPYADWVLLASTLVAMSLAESFLPHLRDTTNQSTDPSASLERLSERYLDWVALFTDDDIRNGDDGEATVWATRVLSTVLECYEEAGYFHRVPSARPLTGSALWASVHARIARRFPTQFHAGGCVATTWVLAALEGVQPTSMFGKEVALREWRLLASSGGEGAEEKVTHEDEDKKEDGAQKFEEPLAAGVSKAAFLCTPSSAFLFPSSPSFAFATAVPRLPLYTTDSSNTARAAQWALAALYETRSAAIQIFKDYVALPTILSSEGSGQSVAAASTRDVLASQPSVYPLLRLLQLLAYLGEPSSSSSPSSLELNVSPHSFLVSECITRDLLPACPLGLAGQLHKTSVMSIAHSGQPGVRALLTTNAAELDFLLPHIASQRLLTALLWSMLPASAVGQLHELQQQEGEIGESGHVSLQIRQQVTLDSFGSGSLAWCVLESHRREMLMDITPESKGDAAVHAETHSSSNLPAEGMIAQPTASHFSSSAKQAHATLGLTLAHLATLANTIPDAARVPLLLAPLAYALLSLAGSVTRISSVAGGDCLGHVAADVQEENAFMDAVAGGWDDVYLAANSGSDMTKVGNDHDDDGGYPLDTEYDSGEGSWLEEMCQADSAGMMEGGSQQRLMVDIPDTESATVRTPVASEERAERDESSDAVGDADDRTCGSAEANADADGSPHLLYQSSCNALNAEMTWNPLPAQHLFYSLLELLAWSFGADPVLLPPRAKKNERDFEKARGLAVYYEAVLSLLSGRGTSDKNTLPAVRLLRGDRRTVERVTMIVCRTCPEVLLLCVLLLRFGGGSAKCDGSPIFSANVEAALCQVLLHAGVTARGVRAWRDEQPREGRRQGIQGIPLSDSDLPSLHLAIYNECFALATGNAGSGTSQNEDGKQVPSLHQECNRLHTRRTLEYLLGSLTLSSMEQRARVRRERQSQHKKASSTSVDGEAAALTTIMRDLHRRNYYVAQFLHDFNASPPGLLRVEDQVVLPSQQLVSLGTRTPPQQAQWLRDVWRRSVPAEHKRCLSDSVAAAVERDQGPSLSKIGAPNTADDVDDPFMRSMLNTLSRE